MYSSWYEVRSKKGRIIHTFTGGDAMEKAGLVAKPIHEVFFVEMKLSEMKLVK